MNHLIVIQEDGQQTIRMAWSSERPGFGTDTFDAAAEAIRAADADSSIACSVFVGVPHCFCYGADASAFQDASNLGALSESSLGFFRALINSKKPLIAGVDGPAAGIGMTMLLHFDAVYTTPNSLFSAPFVDWGLLPDAASTLLFPELLGARKTFELLCLGGVLTPAEAVRLGFVTGIVPASELESCILSAAKHIAGLPPKSLRTTRELLRKQRSGLIRQAKLENDLFQELLSDAATQRRVRVMGRAIKRVLSSKTTDATAN